MDLLILERLFLAPLFALVAAAVVGVLRGFGSVRRLRVWAVLTAFLAGTYLAVRGSGLPYEWTALQALSAVILLTGSATLLRLVDLIFWDWFLSTKRHVSVPRLAVDLFKLVTIVGVVIAILKYDYDMELSGLLVTS